MIQKAIDHIKKATEHLKDAGLELRLSAESLGSKVPLAKIILEEAHEAEHLASLIRPIQWTNVLKQLLKRLGKDR